MGYYSRQDGMSPYPEVLMLDGPLPLIPMAVERTGARAAHIMSTAAKLFHAQGFDSVSLRQLARGAGISPGSLYHYIESKQSLLFELMDDALTAVLDESRRALQELSTEDDGLEAFTSVFITSASTERASFALALRPAPQLSAKQQASLDVQLHSYIDMLKQLVEQRLTFYGYEGVCDERMANTVLCLLKSYLNDEVWLATYEACALYFEMVDTWIKRIGCMRTARRAALALQ